MGVAGELEAPGLFTLAFSSAALALAAAITWLISGFAPGAGEAGVVGRGEPLLDLARFWLSRSSSSGCSLFSTLLDLSVILRL